MDMPNNIKPITTKRLLDEKRDYVSKKSLVNFFLYPAITDENINEINSMGVMAVKLYYGMTTGRIKVGDAEKIFMELNKEILIVAHAEDNSIIEENRKRLAGNEATYHSMLRDCRSDYTAVHDLIELSGRYNRKLHLTHMSCTESLLLIRQAKEKGVKITCDTCPHYLFLDDSLYGKIGNMAKVNPALRPKKNSEMLWNYVNDGTIDTVCSDHAPHNLSEKKKGYAECPAGFPGVETTLQLMLTAIKEGKLNLETFVRLMAENPAKLFGIKNKGCLKEGYDADLAIIDLEKEDIIAGEKLYTKAKWTPFEGFKTKGKAVMTIVNGKIAFDSGKFDDKTKGKEIDLQNI